MLTRMVIRNFKRFGEVDIELGNPVVFIGPNNSGKTTALQALALWDAGLRRWLERHKGRSTPEKRPGVTLNRRDLVSVPVPAANLLWRDLHVRDVSRTNGKQQTRNILVEITVEGVTNGEDWSCGLEFDYANEESFYCRPLHLVGGDQRERSTVPDQAGTVRVAYLPPMSGLTANETRLDLGAINVRIGEGRTAEVLRNLCFQVVQGESGSLQWADIVRQIEGLFRVHLNEPRYIAERGEISMTYRSETGVELDLSASGRGLQQTLLLLVYLQVNPGSVLLLDEPDAHLEVLRQRQIYQILSSTALQQDSQIIAASHSEVFLNEAADRDVVIAFVGRPHRIDDRGNQVSKALKEIGFDQYYQAEQTGWVLYLEGSTDLAILRGLAEKCEHRAAAILQRPFVCYVGNQPMKARDHFYGVREAKPDLVGLAVFDRLERPLQVGSSDLAEHSWSRREIENYLCSREVLLCWAEQMGSRQSGPLFGARWREVMVAAIADLESALAIARRPSPWGPDIKASDEFLDPLFANFYERVGLPNLMRKTDYHVLTQCIEPNAVDTEVIQVLDRIASIADSAVSEAV